MKNEIWISLRANIIIMWVKRREKDSGGERPDVDRVEFDCVFNLAGSLFTKKM